MLHKKRILHNYCILEFEISILYQNIREVRDRPAPPPPLTLGKFRNFEGKIYYFHCRTKLFDSFMNRFRFNQTIQNSTEIS